MQGLGFRPERIAAQGKTHQEYTKIHGNISERRGDLYAKAKLAMGKPEELRGVITAIQKYNLDAAKFKGAIPLINGAALRRAMAAKPEKKFMLYENIFGQAEANP